METVVGLLLLLCSKNKCFRLCTVEHEVINGDDLMGWKV